MGRESGKGNVRDDERGRKEDHQIIYFVLPLLAFCLAGEEEEEEEEENMLQDTYKREVMVMVQVAKTKETTKTKPKTKKMHHQPHANT